MRKDDNCNSLKLQKNKSQNKKREKQIYKFILDLRQSCDFIWYVLTSHLS